MKSVHVWPIILPCIVEFLKKINERVSKLHSKTYVVREDHVASLKVKIII